MQAFLSPERQAKLRQALSESKHISPKGIDKIVGFADDLKEVDRQLWAHANCAEKFGREGKPELTAIAVICMNAIMHEAMERGYRETDFPDSLAFIKKAIKEHHSLPKVQ